MPLDPTIDPNEAYEVTHPPGHPHDIPADWWTVKCNGVPVKHFAPDREDEARRYAKDPAYRIELEPGKKHHER
jgi:hypothetical protein